MDLRDLKGSALVEFVIIAPLLFMMLFGIIEFGFIFYNQAVITNACREGTRYGIVARIPRHTTDEIASVVKAYCRDCLVTFGNQVNPTVIVSHPDGSTDFGDDLEVQVSFAYKFLVLPNFCVGMFQNPMPLSTRTVMKYE